MWSTLGVRIIFIKAMCSNNLLVPVETNFIYFKIAKFEFKLTVHCGPWEESTQLRPLKRCNALNGIKDFEDIDHLGLKDLFHRHVALGFFS